VSLGAGFEGLDSIGNGQLDRTLAVGPTSILVASVGSINLRGKDGRLLAGSGSSAFFHSQGLSTTVAGGDPHAAFDTESGRFFVASIGFTPDPICTPSTCQSYIALAVSKSASPLSFSPADWQIFTTKANVLGSTSTTEIADYPLVSVNHDAVVITVAMNDANTPFTAQAFRGVKIRAFVKSELLSGRAPTFTDFDRLTDPVSGALVGSKSETHCCWPLVPAFMLDRSSDDMFFVNNVAFDDCQVVVWRLRNPFTTRELTNRVIPGPAGRDCRPSLGPEQPNGSPRLDADAPAVKSAAVARNGSLWAAYRTGPGSSIRWIEVDLSDWSTPRLVQDGSLSSTAGGMFYPAIAVDSAGNVGLVSGEVGPATFASVVVAGRLRTDSPGTLSAPVTVRAGEARNTDPKHARGPDAIGWGDYFSAAVDPADDSIWVAGMYAGSDGKSHTWVQQLQFWPRGVIQRATAPNVSRD
jgi:hypothetical protein